MITPNATFPAIVAQNISKGYGDRLALDDVSFELPRGQTLALFGANGAGKTTLLRVLATLLRPAGGTLRLLGELVPDNSYLLRGRVGLLTHEPLLYRDLTARENLDFCARLHGVQASRVTDLLATVELTRRADEPVRNFSKGMLQRVAAARAVIADPELLLLDEPRANLDPHAAELLEPLIGRGRATRVIVTHDVGFGLAESDRVIGLRQGKVALSGATAQITASQVQELYS